MAEQKILTAPVAETPGSSKDSTIWNFQIAPGATYLIDQDGTSFEFTVQTGPVAVRRRTGKFASQFNQFANGTGVSGVRFTSLEVQNLSKLVAVVCQMVVGSANFINHQLVVVQGGIGGQAVVYPTCPTSGVVNEVDFNDLSGSPFTDINGGKWLAIQRLDMVIGNLDSGVTYLLQKKGASGPSDPAIAPIYPLTIWHEAISGDYKLTVGGANLNVIAHEVYQAIPAI